MSASGPFTAVAGATTTTLAVTPTGVTWYNVVITCAASGSFIVLTSILPSPQPTITSTVPYYEGFISLYYNNQLPNCSWAISNPSTALTFSNGFAAGNGIAAFYNNPAGTTYFYSNGIQLNAGVTYSTSLFYSTGSMSYTNWTNISILLGTAQSTTGLVPIISATPVNVQYYTPLGGTFTVATSGVYYLAISGTSNGSGSMYMMWDDLTLTAPCNLPPNSPTVTIASSTGTSICQGEQFTLTASGGDDYLWFNGSTSFSTVVTSIPSVGMNILTVVATNTLTSCASVGSITFAINPTPSIFLVLTSPLKCAFQPVTITAFGASTYSWGEPPMPTPPVITVTPSVTTTYTFYGSNNYSCTGKAFITVTVLPLPTLQVSGATTLCENELLLLTASGASSYTWSNTANTIAGNPLSVTVPSSTTYTLTGTGLNGCAGSQTIAVTANVCAGITEGKNPVPEIYPNPFSTEVRIQCSDLPATLTVLDVTGRLVFEKILDSETTLIKIENLEKGIYYFQLTDHNNQLTKKMIRE
jgi:hypothetical protein